MNCATLFTALLLSLSRMAAVRHASPDFPFSRRPCYSPVSQPSSSFLKTTTTTTSGRTVSCTSGPAAVLGAVVWPCSSRPASPPARRACSLRLLRPPLWPCIYTSSLPRPSRGPTPAQGGLLRGLDCGLWIVVLYRYRCDAMLCYAIETYPARCIALCALAPLTAWPGLACSLDSISISSCKR